jgi:hypothetical protein
LCWGRTLHLLLVLLNFLLSAVVQMRLADEHVADVLLVVQDVQQHGADGAGARV